MVNRNWHDYKLPTALDVPAGDDVPAHRDPGSTKPTRRAPRALGSPSPIPTAAAIANAVYHATGIRMTASPINPVTLCEALAERQKGGIDHDAEFSYVRVPIA